jgi:hypothetical protein
MLLNIKKQLPVIGKPAFRGIGYQDARRLGDNSKHVMNT